MSTRKRWTLIALVWACCLALLAAGWRWPAVMRAVNSEQLPIGWATGWLACLGWQRRRRKSSEDPE